MVVRKEKMSAFDITGPSKIGKILETQASHSRASAKVSERYRESKEQDPAVSFNGASATYRKSYKELRMIKK